MLMVGCLLVSIGAAAEPIEEIQIIAPRIENPVWDEWQRHRAEFERLRAKFDGPAPQVESRASRLLHEQVAQPQYRLSPLRQAIEAMADGRAP